MRKMHHNDRFCWTLRGKPCFLLSGFSLTLLILSTGVMQYA